MAQINNPHDHFFKATFSDKLVVKAFLRRFLSKEVLDTLDLNSLEALPNSYIDENLEESFFDLVFRCKTKDGKEKLISILFEHKSFYDKYSPFQLLGYSTSSYQIQIANKKEPIPVIPILLVHSKKGYEKKQIVEFFGNYSSSVLKYVPNFDYVLIDLANMESHELENLGNQFLIAALLGFKYSDDSDRLVNQLDAINRFLLKSHSENLIRSFFIYFSNVVDLTPNKILTLYKALPNKLKSDAMSSADMLIEKGKEIGKERGKENEKTTAATNLILEGMPNEFICRVLNVSDDFVEMLRRSIKKG